MILRTEFLIFALYLGILLTILGISGALPAGLTVTDLDTLNNNNNNNNNNNSGGGMDVVMDQSEDQGNGGDGGTGRLPPSKSLMEKAHDLFVTMMYKSEIPGMPGKDYPILADIPSTQFRCRDHFNVGYYADVQSGCQVIHVCQVDGSHESFLCPNGTIFNQQYFVCDWWFNVDCNQSPTYYELNGGFGKVSEKNYYQEPAEKVAEKDYFQESRIVEVKH